MSVTDRVPAWTLAVGAMVSVQLGAAVSVHLFPSVGVAGTAWLRLVVAAAAFLLWARPRFGRWSVRDLRAPALLGVVTAVMLTSFMVAIDHLPLGTAVAIEFLGPLTVAAARTRTRRALVWPLLAFAGVLLLTEPWAGRVDLVGVAFALVSALCWGTYILLTQHVGDQFSGVDGLAISIPVAAVTASFVGAPQAVGGITPGVLGLAVLAGLLAPVVPFALELFALRRLTAAAFGTLMALEPALGTLVGAVLLRQLPSALQVVGVALVVVAGIGAERIGHREGGPAQLEPLG